MALTVAQECSTLHCYIVFITKRRSWFVYFCHVAVAVASTETVQVHHRANANVCQYWPCANSFYRYLSERDKRANMPCAHFVEII